MTSDPGLAIPHHLCGSLGGSHCLSVLGGSDQSPAPPPLPRGSAGHWIWGLDGTLAVPCGARSRGCRPPFKAGEPDSDPSSSLCGTLDTYLQTRGNLSHDVFTFIFCPMLSDFSSLDFNYTYLRQFGIVPKIVEALFTFLQSFCLPVLHTE